MAHQPRNLRDFVEARADGRCEYCRRYQDMIGETFFEVEHIVPRARGGLTVPHNLAFACRRCNLLKSDATEARDRRTGRRVPCLTRGAITGVITSDVAATKRGYTAALR